MSYRYTRAACCGAYVVQAVVVIYPSLLFLVFRDSFRISAGWISLLICLNFGVQLGADLMTGGLAERYGYRTCMLASHGLVTAGLWLLARVLDEPQPTAAMLGAAIGVCAFGGGMLEVLIGAVTKDSVEEGVTGALSLLHSFYCWGCVIVIVTATGFVWLFGKEKWIFLTVFLGCIPLLNGLLFCFLPLPEAEKRPEERDRGNLRQWAAYFGVMLCAGAAEHTVSQWASTIAELELGLPKQIGDLAGPLVFAALMGAGRLLYGIYGDRLELGGTLRAACFGCAAGYCLIAFGTVPAAVLGFGMVGLFVSVLWPAACAMAAERAPVGTAALFSFLAIFGDIGCAAGPAVVGFLWEHRELSLRGTVGLGAVYPLAAWWILSSCMKKKK